MRDPNGTRDASPPATLPENMLRLLAATVLLATLSQCNAPVGEAWRASDVRGDSPGIGFELRNENGKIAGDAYIIDAAYPHDFSHAKRARLVVAEQSGKEIIFRAQWNRDLSANFRFEFQRLDWTDSFEVKVSEVIGSDTYDTETYVFAKAR
jgi:hypothetical protein